jgi:hypothetical protein
MSTFRTAARPVRNRQGWLSRLWDFAARTLTKPRSAAYAASLRMERLESRLYLDGSGLAFTDEAGTAEAEGGPLPDFALVDVNPASARYSQTVSPRDYLGAVSVWMFGYST